MSKQNNKGFSLIDVIIAAAVLSLLVAPILINVTTTLKTSSRAKEKQYVLDNAQYILNYFQNTENSKLVVGSTDSSYSGANKVTDSTAFDNRVTITSYQSGKIPCKLYYVDNTGATGVVREVVDSYGNQGEVNYTASIYGLQNAQLGKQNTTYSRRVVVDDLNNKVLAATGYGTTAALKSNFLVNYSIDKSNLPTAPTAPAGCTWEYRNNGSYVLVGDYTDTSVTPIEVYHNVVLGIVCEKKDKYEVKAYNEDGTEKKDFSGNQVYNPIDYVDPNAADIGFIQNLNQNTVALIQGNAAGFDKDAEAEFFGMKMNVLKNRNYEQYQQVVTTKTGQTGFNQADATYKVTKISIYQNADSTYQVECAVYYYERYKLFATDTNYESPLSVSYPVFSKTFHTDKSPDIYFIYEPYVTESSDDPNLFRYSDKDFIEVYNDANCVDSKLYLIKPSNDQLTVKYKDYIAGGKTASFDLDSLDEGVFYTKTTSGGITPVKIELSWLKGAGVPKPLHVYTNLTTESKDLTPVEHNLTNYEAVSGGNYIHELIKTTKPSLTKDNVSGVECEVKDYFGDPTDNEFTTVRTATMSEDDLDYILPIEEDKDASDRLYTVSVVLTELDDSGNATNNTITFSGAKGVN